MDQQTENRLLGTLYDRLYDIVTYRPASARSLPDDPTARNKTMLHLSKDFAVSPTDFGNAYGPANLEGDLGQAEALAKMLDVVPSLSADWSDSLLRVSHAYRGIVTSANSDVDIDPAQKHRYDEAFDYLYEKRPVQVGANPPKSPPQKSAAYLQYIQNQTAYFEALTSYREAQVSYDLTRRNDQLQWVAREPALRNKLNQAWNAYRGGDAPQVEIKLATIDTTINSIVRSTLEEARQRLSQSELTSMVQGGGPWYPTYAVPSDWASDDGVDNYSRLTLSSDRLATSFSSEYNSWSGSASFGFGFWSIGVGASGSSTQVHRHMDADHFRLSAKVANVRIQRDWLNASLFRLHNWSLEGEPKGCVSSGTITHNTGLLPNIPVSMIVARDIEIGIDLSNSDYNYMQSQWSAGASIGWGPFSFGGTYNHSQTDERFTSEYNGGTLRVPGIQILGFVSAITPYSPPDEG